MSGAGVWHAPDELPGRKGWYLVRRVGEPETLFVRPFGAGMWWTPLADGWLGRCEPKGLYEWRARAICDMEPEGSELSPLDEMRRAAERAGVAA